MRRAVIVLALAGLAAAGAALVQRLGQERQYRRLLAAGDEALASGRSNDAVEAYSGAIALRPDSMVAYFRRGEAHQLQRRADAAIRDLREASRMAPEATPPLVALGRLFDSQGDPARAAEWYARAANQLRGEDPSLLYAVGLAHYRAGAPAAARQPLERAVARHDATPEACYLLGIVCRDLNDLDCALARLDQAARLAALSQAPPERRTLIAAREELADLHRAAGRTVEEVEQLQALAALDTAVSRRVDLALAQTRQGQSDLALSSLASGEAATDSAAHVARARVHLARAERTGRRDAVLAISELESALGGTTRRSEGLALFGRALYLSGDTAGALRVLRQAVTTSPLDLEAFEFLADAAERSGLPLEARDALLSLDVLEGDTASPARRGARARRIGMLSWRSGDASQTVRHLQQALNAGLQNADVMAALVEAYWRLGDTARAREMLTRALATDPRHAGLLRLRRTLGQK